MIYKTAFSVLGSGFVLGVLFFKDVNRRPAVMQNDTSGAPPTGRFEPPEDKSRPSLSCGTPALSSTAVVHSANFLNEYLAEHGGNSWGADYDDFSGFARTVGKGKPCFRLLRLRGEYTPPGENAQPVPIMRLLGFFPATTTAELYTRVTDLKLRREWDTNYQMFERFPTKQAPPKGNIIEAAANRVDEGLPKLIDEKMCRPTLLDFREKPQFQNDGLYKLLSDVEARVVDRGWFSHAVGSSFLSRLGLAPRLFFYERVSYQYNFADQGILLSNALPQTYGGFSKQPPLLIYDVLYSGTQWDTKIASRSCSALQDWIEAIRKRIFNYVDVELNYLHLLLLPITDYDRQILGDPHGLVKQLSESGSINDETATRIVCEIFKDSAKLLADAQTANSFSEEAKKMGGKSGVLLLMTAANNVGVPQSLPQFVQTTLATAISKQAYQNLMKACHTSSS